MLRAAAAAVAAAGLLLGQGAAGGKTAASQPEGLTATSAQRLAAMVDAAASMATSSEQLAATWQSLEDSFARGDGGEVSSATLLREPLRALAELNGGLRDQLRLLRDELGELFSTGRSVRLRSVLRALASLPAQHAAQLRDATLSALEWPRRCRAPAALSRYGHFESLHLEHRAAEAELRSIGSQVFVLRDERAAADGTLAGLEERLSLQRARRNGEEYELARYLGSSLFRWDLLRTKVAHHLAHTFTAAQEAAREGTAGTDSQGGAEFAERQLGELEEKLQHAAASHKRLADQRQTLGKQLRSFLKSLVLSCEAASGERSPEAAVSKRYQVLRGKSLGVFAQAAEEFARFLNGTYTQALPQAVALLEEVLSPYAADDDAFVLPTAWKARPKMGRWWEWLEESGRGGGTGGSLPVDSAEFEHRFAAAKRRFSLRVSAAEPVVMAYSLWHILEDELGPVPSDIGHQEVVLSLPSPEDAPGEQSNVTQKPLRNSTFPILPEQQKWVL